MGLEIPTATDLEEETTTKYFILVVKKNISRLRCILVSSDRHDSVFQ